MAPQSSAPLPFSAVHAEEIQEICRSRSRRLSDTADLLPTANAGDLKLIGLAFSGGGIRSATFNLGVLQALASHRLLPYLDYLSTVSGGGYIGSWFACWCKRLGGVEELQNRLADSTVEDPTQEEFYPIRFLRQYSNYLTPRTGFFSADTWASVAIWCRNTILNQTVLIGCLTFVLLAARMLGQGLLDLQSETTSTHQTTVQLFTYGAMLALLVACIGCALQLRWFQDGRRVAYGAHKGRSQGAAIVLVVAPLVVCSTLANFALKLWLQSKSLSWAGSPVHLFGIIPIPLADDPGSRALIAAGICGVLFFALLMTIAALGWYPDAFYHAPPRYWKDQKFDKRCLSIGGITLASLGASVLGAVLIRIYCGIVEDWTGIAGTWITLTAGTPVMLTIFGFTKAFQVGLLGLNFPDERREWWSRLAAWLIVVCVVWLGLFAAAVYAPLVVASIGTWVLAPGGVWIATTWKGLQAAKSAFTGKQSVSENPKPSPVLDVLAKVFPYVFIAGLVVTISAAMQWILRRLIDGHWLTPKGMEDQYWALFSLPWLALGLALAAVFIVSSIFGWRVDINEFSLHHFYKNRLSRCYLGASRPYGERHPNPFTGFDPYDDPKLARFRVNDPIQTVRPKLLEDLLVDEASAVGKPYAGPYPILNTALNIASGEDLAWQERMAESFVFTPLYCGFEVPRTPAAKRPETNIEASGYRPTDQFGYGHDQGPAIGTAMAISGAAANPNMGYHTSPATAVIMTFFNARLGWWMGNPRHKTTWRNSSPGLGLAYLLNELLRNTTDHSGYVNLSDGGHFENLGIYELVRRRCRLIIACDAEEDHDFTFGGLGSAIRKCRTDFGVEIKINVDKIRPDKESLFSGQHFALGTVTYPLEPGARQSEPGWLLYIKASKTGSESTDVREYADREKQFPHQSTADQWFDESQFESYRKLGFEAADAALSSLQLDQANSGTRDQILDQIRVVFSGGRAAAASPAG